MQRRSQQGGTHALYGLLEEEARLRKEEARLRKKAESRAGRAEAEVVRLRALLEERLSEAEQERPSCHLSTTSSLPRTPPAAANLTTGASRAQQTPLRGASEGILSDVLPLVLPLLSPSEVAMVAGVSRAFHAATLHVSWPELKFAAPDPRVDITIDVEDVSALPGSLMFDSFVKFMCRGKRCDAVHTISLRMPIDVPLHHAANVASAVELVRACRLLQALTFSQPRYNRGSLLMRSLCEDPVLSERLREHLESLTVLGTYPEVDPAMLLHLSNPEGSDRKGSNVIIWKCLKHLRLPFGLEPGNHLSFEQLLLGLPSLETLSVSDAMLDFHYRRPMLRSSTLERLIVREGVKCSFSTNYSPFIECPRLRSVYIGSCAYGASDQVDGIEVNYTPGLDDNEQLDLFHQQKHTAGLVRRLLPSGWRIAADITGQFMGRFHGVDLKVSPAPNDGLRDE